MRRFIVQSFRNVPNRLSVHGTEAFGGIVAHNVADVLFLAVVGLGVLFKFFPAFLFFRSMGIMEFAYSLTNAPTDKRDSYENHEKS